MKAVSTRERLIVALDVPTVDRARALVELLGDSVTFYKIGLELVSVGGFELAAELKSLGKSVFLDLKLHDIPNTVERATANIAQLGVDIVTVHAYPQTMIAARKGRGESALKVIGVTMLTSMSEQDAKEAGYALEIAEIVHRRAVQAAQCNIDGLVCSPAEASLVRSLVGPDRLVVTPGVRPLGAASDDQSRIATPEQALAAGASHLVVGRPITQSTAPRQMADTIVADITRAFKM